MIIRCENEATRVLTDEGDRVEFSQNGKARVKKEVGERLEEKYRTIQIEKDETTD